MGGNRLLWVVFQIFLCQNAKASSILAVFSSLSYSDHLVFRGYVSSLTQRGHSVVVMTPYPGHFQYPDIERIVELDVGAESAPFWDEYKILMSNTDDYYPRQRALNELSLKTAIAQLRSKQMTALLINPNIKFDLVITEADVPLLYAVADKYGAPHISITTSSGKINQHESKGNPIHPILYLDVHSLNNGRNLTRLQKVVEFYRHLRLRNEYYYNYLTLSDIAAKKIFDTKKNLLEMEYDIDMLFIANNPILCGNRPTVPAITYVDRLHIKPGHLPQNLQTILDEATKGAVFFSLGAIQDSEEMSAAILKTITDAFSELPFTILWKIGNTTAVNITSNVIAQNWFPQQYILAHPNVKAFITSGGSRSLEEAIFYQVPIIGFPIVRPRINFIKQVTKFNAGEMLDPYQLNKETLISTVMEVATNESYKNAMIKLKDMVFDSVISGPENAVWWTEYVIRHNGAKHLRSPAVGIGYAKYFLLDLILYAFIGSLILVYLIFITIRSIIKRLRARYFAREEESKFKIL